MIRLMAIKDSARAGTCGWKKRNFPKAICALGVLLLTVMAARQLPAQTTTATILGTVMDSSGAVVEGANVVVTNTGTGIPQNVVTDSQGRYTASLLPIGDYKIEFAKPGFQKLMRTGITLTLGSQFVVDAKLQVGQAVERVEVQGQAAEVETTSSTLGSLTDETQMRELPLNGRNYVQLLALAPGVQTAQSGGLGFLGRGEIYSFAGSVPWGQAFLLDDADITNIYDRGGGVGVLGTTLGIDGIAEFTTLTNAYSAQYGGNGAVLNAVTRSGTNDLHGSAFEFIRNSAVDARNYYDPLTGPPPFKRNQFGATLGGPIKKDKAFFFFNYEGLRSDQETTGLAEVPDADGLAGYVDGATYAINSVIKPFLAVFPTGATPIIDPATGLDSGTGKIKEVAGEIGSENYFLGRVDYHFSNNDSLYGRFVSDRGTYLNPFVNTVLPGFEDNETSKNLYFTMEERHVFSSHVINDARASYVRNTSFMVDTTFNSLFDFYPNSGFKDQGKISITGLSALGDTPGDPTSDVQDKTTFADDVILNKGAHTVTAGFSAELKKELNINPFLFAGSYTFNSLRDFLQDNPHSYIGTETGNVLGQHWFWSYELAPYINDDWKITRKLTANLGLRYDFLSDIKCYSGPCYGVSNPLTATANATRGLTLTPYILAQSAAKRNFEPRVGFAYDLFGDHKTSIRGGFAIFHTLMSTGELMEGVGDNYPFVTALAIAPTWFPCAWDGCSASTVTPKLPPASVGPYQAYNTDDSPRLLTWNGDVQRELLKGSVLQVGYVGSRGIHQSMYVDVNSPTLTTASGSPYTGTGTPYFASVSGAGQVVSNPLQNPVFGPVLEQINTGLSRYNSLQVSFNRQLTGYWQLQANYALSKCDDVGDGGGTAVQNGIPVQNPYNPFADYGPCGYTSRNVLHINTVIIAPFHGNRAVEGWQFSAIVSANSGQPVTPLVGWDSAGLDTGNTYPGDRPNLNPGYSCGKGLTTGNPNGWFKTAAFSVPTLGTIGNAPRGCITGPGVFEPDISLSKETKISELVRAQLRFEVFNFVNKANFAQPGLGGGAQDASWDEIFTSPPSGSLTSTVSPSAGIITATATSSRQMQLGLKIIF